jgi:hypothetical protein
MARIDMWFRKHWIVTTVLGLIALALIFAHFYLHAFLVKFVNKKLDSLPGYHARIKDIGVHLWRGAYSIEGLRVLKDTGKVPVPFVAINDIDISVQWSQLFRGRIVAEIDLDRPVIHLVTSEEKPEQKQTKVEGPWQDQVKDLIPFKLNHVSIANGEIHFQDFTSDPPMDVFVQKLYLTASNLTNTKQLSETLAATIIARGIVMKDGELKAEATADPYAKLPTFKAVITMKGLGLPQLNDFFKKYAAVEVKDGKLDIYSEMAASKGELKGYLTPLITDLDKVELKDEKKSVGEVFKGLAVKFLLSFLENPPKDRVGTRLEFSGRVDDPKMNIWVAISSSLRNALTKAIPAKLDRSIDMKDRNSTEVQKVNKK